MKEELFVKLRGHKHGTIGQTNIRDKKVPSESFHVNLDLVH